jgi:hypothetical protein
LTGDLEYREQGLRSFNWATYMANEDGTVTVGVDRPDYYNQCWFTDGYFDFVPHFIDGMAAIPEMAPFDSDHLLRSTTVVQEIQYSYYQVTYRTFRPGGNQKFRLTFKPVQVLAGGHELSPLESTRGQFGWSFDERLRVLDVHADEQEVILSGR